jgi:hypothetical protein
MVKVMEGVIMRFNLRGVIFLVCGCMMAMNAHADMEAIDPSFDINKTLFGVARVTEMGEVGVFENYRYQCLGFQRNARIYVPENYDPARPIGVLFGFHGYKNKVTPHPSLENLRNIEPLASEEYFITVALATRYRPDMDGWYHGWNHHQNGMENVDARAVYDLLRTLKAHYNIDEGRIFGEGHSNGAGFLGTVGNNLPNTFAAMWPRAPVCGEYLPAFNNTYATMGYGGIFDEYGTERTVRQMNKIVSQAPAEAAFYVFGMDHQPRGNMDDNVEPALSFEDKALEFFRNHPRHYQYYGFVPTESAPFFGDDFSDGATKLSSERWRVDSFDKDGIMGDQAGYAFRVVNGRLVNIPYIAPETSREGNPRYTTMKLSDDRFMEHTVYYKDSEAMTLLPPSPKLATTPVGGLCRTLFYKELQLEYGVEFSVENFGKDSRIMPLWIADTRGRVHALVITADRYRWETYPTHHHFRMGVQATLKRPGNPMDDYLPPDPILQGEGPFDLIGKTRYSISLNRQDGEFTWDLIESYTELKLGSGKFSLRADDSYQFGFGVTGIGAEIAVDKVYIY